MKESRVNVLRNAYRHASAHIVQGGLRGRTNALMNACRAADPRPTRVRRPQRLPARPRPSPQALTVPGRCQTALSLLINSDRFLFTLFTTQQCKHTSWLSFVNNIIHFIFCWLLVNSPVTITALKCIIFYLLINIPELNKQGHYNTVIQIF